MTSLPLWRKQGCELPFWLTNCDRTVDSLAIVEPSYHLTTLIKPPRCRSDVCCRHGRGGDVSLRRPAKTLTALSTETNIWMNENGATVIFANLQARDPFPAIGASSSSRGVHEWRAQRNPTRQLW
jgi:hypothetical protein